jgi:hypothetical protein
MADVVSMLSSETTILGDPKQPAYYNVRVGNNEETATATTTTESYDVSMV